MIIIIAAGYLIAVIILIALLNDYLHRSYLKNLKRLIDYNDEVIKELEKLIEGCEE